MYVLTKEGFKIVLSSVSSIILETILSFPLHVPHVVKKKFNFALRKANIRSIKSGK